MPPTRRAFLRAAAASAIAPVFAHGAVGQKTPPNILFCIADDWSFGHASIYGDKTVQTPVFDRLAREGALFTHSFCVAPTCTASRGGILTGQPPHRLEEGANLWSTLPAKFATYPDLLESAGDVIGLTGKGWGPGALGQRKRNPAGPAFRNFDAFVKSVPDDKSFCYWFGSQDPHRPYERQLTVRMGLKRESVAAPPFLPDTPEVRDDLLDYYAEVQRYDENVGRMLDTLAASGRAENTIVVVTSDNGLPFPHAKANLYDAGTRMPLAIRFPGVVKPGSVVHSLVSHLDFAPTFLELAGLKIPGEMAGRSLLGTLTGADSRTREWIFVERERHARARAENVGYPCRAIRSEQYLYIRNFHAERWPAGDPDLSFSQGTFSDIDAGPTKKLLLDGRDDPRIAPFFHLACDKRPAEELYDVASDPYQMRNVAGEAKLAAVRQQLWGELRKWMADTADPRAASDTDVFDAYPYVGAR